MQLNSRGSIRHKDQSQVEQTSNPLDGSKSFILRDGTGGVDDYTVDKDGNLKSVGKLATTDDGSVHYTRAEFGTDHKLVSHSSYEGSNLVRIDFDADHLAKRRELSGPDIHEITDFKHGNPSNVMTENKQELLDLELSPDGGVSGTLTKKASGEILHIEKRPGGEVQVVPKKS